jgi:hypothetical protein
VRHVARALVDVALARETASQVLEGRALVQAGER